MAEVTKIAWTHSTFNPWIGCTKIAPGCDNCYASATDTRFTGGKRWGAGVPRHRTSAAYWRQPINWNRKAAQSGKPWRVFCASQADVFDNEVSQSWREDLFELIRATPHLTWLLLTKRIGNVGGMLPKDWGAGYPNVWLGITVVTQPEANRDIPKLAQIPAIIRWLSLEPQIERIDLEYPESLWPNGPPICCSGNECSCRGLPIDPPLGWKIDWAITGGESAQLGKCRPYDIDWARSLLRQRVPGMNRFVKQLGSKAVDRGQPIRYTGKGDDPAEWPAEIRVREFPDDDRRA